MTGLDSSLPAEIERLAALEDPYELLQAVTKRMAEAQREVTELARLRRRVIEQLHGQGRSYAQIAEAAGLSRGRIHQLRHRGPAPEGAFLGVGGIIIATPLKQEARNARPVVAVEDFTAAQRIADLARTMQLDVEFEQVPLDGDIDLNRPNLIVVCGPRLSDTVAGVLAQDPFIQFERADDGPWTLHDRSTGKHYRSGSDSSPPRYWDAAYLGRLPRPDGRGLVMIFTGIHPPGTLGVVHLITTEINSLYEQVDAGQFSTLVGVDYTPDANEPVNVQLLTPLYRHQEG
jgi:Sigma-70, region 4